MHDGSKGRKPADDIEHEAPAAEVDSIAAAPPTSTPPAEAVQPLARETVPPASVVDSRGKRIAAMLGAQPAAPESPTASATGPSSARRDSTMPGHPASRTLPMMRSISGESTPEGLTSPAAPESPTVAAVTGPSSARRPSTMPGQRAILGQPASRVLPVMARAGSDGTPPVLGRRLSAADTESSIDESLLAAQERHNAANVTATIALLQAVTADPTKLTPELWRLVQDAQQLHATLAASAAANMLAPQADAAAATTAETEEDVVTPSPSGDDQPAAPLTVGQLRRASVAGPAAVPHLATMDRSATEGQVGLAFAEASATHGMGPRQDSALLTEAGAAGLMRMDSEAEANAGRPASPPLGEFGGDRSGLRPGAHSPIPSEASTQPASGTTATVTAPTAMMPPPAPLEEPDVTTPQA